MKVGIISDTHDHLVGLKKAIEVFKKQQIDFLIHCGDWVSPYTLKFFDQEMEGLEVPIKSLIGNNVGDQKGRERRSAIMKHQIDWTYKEPLELDLDGKKTAVCHGHDLGLLNSLIESQKYDLIITGHTHEARNEIIGKTLVINPGSTSFANEGRIIDKASVAIYDTETEKAEIIFF
jgi:putative phosphoesterase